MSSAMNLFATGMSGSSAMDQASLALASAKSAQTPEQSANYQRAEAAAKQYEGVFISQMLGQMFKGVETDPMFGGGPGESMFRSLMIDEYGKEISARGGIGLAKPLLQELLKVQEHSS